MGKYLKVYSEPELIVQEVEEFMNERKVQISVGVNDSLIISIDKTEGLLVDIETGEEVREFPRHFESERIRVGE